MSHDTFAQKVVAFAEANGLSSYGLIGHSQGGIVSLHILNYYWTGLDNAVGKRKIQSLCSPYQGNSGAGAGAEILKLLGGCGSNTDMTRDGAVLWIAGISQASMQQTNYYTTQYKAGGLFGQGWCNMAVNLVLKRPNDGTAEQPYSTLPFGNHVEHYVGQCHIPDMNWPPAYWDTARNSVMNSLAAR